MYVAHVSDGGNEPLRLRLRDLCVLLGGRGLEKGHHVLERLRRLQPKVVQYIAQVVCPEENGLVGQCILPINICTWRVIIYK